MKQLLKANFFSLKSERFFAYTIVLFCFLHSKNEIIAQNKKPNIILILGDDIGYKVPSVNGGKSYSTPNLDMLAQQGMNFTQCQSSPLCSPSRFLLLTGKYNFRNYTKWGLLDTSQRTIGNVFKDAGYKTACFGKWQLNGGEISIHKFGFDSYCVYDPLGSEQVSRYKNPVLYTNGSFIPDELTINKYSEDIFADSVMNFIDNNKSVPFFIYYPMVLAHTPQQPTPDDSDFASLQDLKINDTSYFASMIKYMDQKIGAIVNKVKEAGIQDNTVIIYMGDNGTTQQVSEDEDDYSSVMGGKGLTTEFGTHVPLMIYWPGTIKPGTINNDLIGFTDFLPTLADIAKIPVSENYKPLDGVSFASRVFGNPSKPRQWLFYHYEPHPGLDTLKRWAQTTQYKLYDTSANDKTLLFYNIAIDPQEINPLKTELLTPDEIAIKQQLLDVINEYINEGFPILGESEVLSVTDSSAIILDSIKINGGSTIKASGVVWDTNHNPVLSRDNYTSENGYEGRFTSFITNLKSNTTYYVRTYATNNAGTAYGKELVFTTYPNAPVSTTATEIDNTSFVAKWNNVNKADNYKIDVSQVPEFSVSVPDSIVEEFDGGIIHPKGWYFNSDLAIDTLKFGKASPSIKFKYSNEAIYTAVLQEPATSISFWIQGLKDSAGTLLIEGYDGVFWKSIGSIANISKKPVIKTYDLSLSMQTNKFIRFRFIYSRQNGHVLFDDVTIRYNLLKPSFVPGYENLSVDKDSLKISGLTKNTQYFYRVRAENINGTSGNSNTIAVVTCTIPTILNVSSINPNCNGYNSGSIAISTNDTGLNYTWSGPNDFKSTNKNIDNLIAGNYHVIIAAGKVCKTDTTILLIEPPSINVTLQTNDSALCYGDSTIMTIQAKGGTGNYQYSLLNGIRTIGPQNDNHFKIGAGSYTVRIEDSNDCSFTTKSIHIKNLNCDTSLSDEDPLIKIFPNPAINQVNLTIQTNRITPIQIIITDRLGKKVYQFFGKNIGKYFLGEGFISGIYFAHISQDKFEKTFKFIIVNK